MYRNLNSLALGLTKKGGFLMTCSCSGAVTQIGGAASMVGRKITVVRQSSAASDHPIDPSYPEGSSINPSENLFSLDCNVTISLSIYRSSKVALTLTKNKKNGT
uniref:Uncharacterized protein n=1 Tax=Manihot esculenta TaxID=3983 RepID=A0A2C9W649_MANES